VDDFESGSMNLAVDGIDYPPTPSASLTLVADVIGGQRDVALDYLSGLYSSHVYVNRAKSGSFVLAEDPDTQARATLTYGAGGSLNADLAAQGPSSAFRFVFSTADLAGTLSIQASSDGQGTSTWTGSTPGGLFNTNLDFDVPLSGSGWVAASGGGVNWGDVDKLTISLTGVANGDYVIRQIVVVPEPATLSLIVLGGLASLLKRRRR
ncbi:MAG: PEP-CTERM sorting domain-containing protein, partial [Planctomycetota bacterium]